jgi:hypothetical protein
MGPDKDSPVRPKNQATGSMLGSLGCRRRARRGGSGRRGAATASPRTASRSGRRRVAATGSAGRNDKRKKALPSPPRGSSLSIFFRAPAPARAAMRSSTGVGDRPCSGFVPGPAATLCSAFWSGRGAGANDGGGRNQGTTPAEPGIPCGDKSLPISSRHIAVGLSIPLSLGCAPRRGRGSEARRGCAASFSLLLHAGRRAPGWNWNFINSRFVTNG